MIQIDNKQWLQNEDFAPLALLCLPFSVEHVERAINVHFEECSEDGLGTCYYCFLRHDTFELLLKGYLSKQHIDPGVVVEMHSTEKEPLAILNFICDILNIDRNELPWITEHLSSPRFVLYRIDDNANEVEMKRFHEESMARAVANVYQKRGHKQLYLVREET